MKILLSLVALGGVVCWITLALHVAPDGSGQAPLVPLISEGGITGDIQEDPNLLLLPEEPDRFPVPVVEPPVALPKEIPPVPTPTPQWTGIDHLRGAPGTFMDDRGWRVTQVVPDHVDGRLAQSLRAESDLAFLEEYVLDNDPDFTNQDAWLSYLLSLGVRESFLNWGNPEPGESLDAYLSRSRGKVEAYVTVTALDRALDLLETIQRVNPQAFTDAVNLVESDSQ